ncbi:MAG TPA: di-heme oxidoredictase family protein [Bryobacteraceae bacterium]|nr:di-heme oxidoredictase family protein [Bryobacteraceae bacterium]
MPRTNLKQSWLRNGCLGAGILIAIAALAQTPTTSTTPITTPTTSSAAIPKDPGVRGGPPGAGGTFTTLDPNPTNNQADHDFFLQTLSRFQEIDSVSGTIEGGNGLGPAFNMNSCAGCHAQPAIGGSSPAVNPQMAAAHADGASNPGNTSDFLSASGPVREVRFIKNSDGSPDGGVHDIFTIAGRTDAPGCDLAQPDFHTQIVNNNAIFRIPTPTFGNGLVEAVSDSALQANLASTASQRAALGIGGRFNTSGNDGTVTRFGWKAQNKSLLMFAGEAYNVEQGVTNNIFPNDRFPGGTPATTIANCTYNYSPEDGINIINPQQQTVVNGKTVSNPNFGTTHGTVSEMSSDLVNFAAFMQLLAPPTPVTSTASQLNGQNLFNQTGCALCHSPTLTTVATNGRGINGGATSTFPGFENVQFHPYSDFAIHHMGSTLADGVSQGAAGPDEFRTAPLWGIGQRIFFLHDGRTTDLLQAIAAHADNSNDCAAYASGAVFNRVTQSGNSFYALASTDNFCGSEANQVIKAFNALTPQQKQDILNFLRSL